MTQEMAKAFDKYFSMVPATTPELLEKVYRLRYHVLCLETGFLQPGMCPGGMEKDQYDERSVHYLIQHKETGSYAATTRLILPDMENPEHLFSIEQHSQIERTDILESIPRLQIAEASRFCVSKDFKRRPGEPGTVSGVSPENIPRYHANEDERRTFPHITVALMGCLVRINALSGHRITHCYALMEPALIRFFKQFGMNFTSIGPGTNHYGLRIPCIFEVQTLLDGVKKENLNVWNFLTDYGRFSRS